MGANLIHRNGVEYLDITPYNILVFNYGKNAKIDIFGLGKTIARSPYEKLQSDNIKSTKKLLNSKKDAFDTKIPEFMFCEKDYTNSFPEFV